MATERNRIYLQHPQKEDEFLPAQLLKEEEGVLSVRLLEELLLPPQSESRHYFHDQDEAFCTFSCQVLRMESAGPQPVVSIVQTGPTERHEQRETFRVGVFDQWVSAEVNDEDQAEVVNISYQGLGMVLEDGSYAVGTWLKVVLTFDTETAEGYMQIRNRKERKDGRYRYGLMADPDCASLVKALNDITQTLQQVKARRASRLGTNNRYPKHGSANDAVTQSDKGEQKQSPGDSRQFVSPDGTKREHLRKNWPGKGKVYILEERQLRVLDVNTIDISQGGMCFTCKQFIYQDTELLFEKPAHNGLFRITAKVRASHMNDQGMHRIGVQFTSPPLKPGETHPKFYMV